VIEIRKPRPPVSAQALADAEERLAAIGQRLPPSYRAFLADHDGGRPVKDYFSFQQHGRVQHDLVKRFFGIAPAPGGSLFGDLVSVAGTAEHFQPGVLPIAGDPFGNHICLDTREGRDGPVLFLDHEEGTIPPDDSNQYWIAPDLQTFLDSLTERPPRAPAKPKPRGWRSLFTRR